MPLVLTVNDQLLAQYNDDICAHLRSIREARTPKEREYGLWSALDCAAQTLDGAAFAATAAKPNGEPTGVGDLEVLVSAITYDGDVFGHWYPVEATANLLAGGYTPAAVAQMIAENLNAASLRLIREFT